jgi:transposase InsO family protein
VQLVDEESTATVMAALKRVVEGRGLFCSLYSDRGSHMAWTPKAGGSVDPQKPTQIAPALDQLGIELILAYSPQARGRCERLFGTWQGRLPQEFRLRQIRTVEAANEFLRQDWIVMHDARFSVKAEQTGTAFLPYPGHDLDKIFSLHHERTIDNDNTVRWEGRCLQIPQQTFRFSMARCRVLVCEHLDQTMSVHYGPHLLGRYDAAGQLLQLAYDHKPRRSADRRRIMKADAIGDRHREERKKNQKRKKGAACGN